MGLFSSTVNCRTHVRSSNTILWHILCANRMIGNIECLIEIFFRVCTLSARLTSCWTHMRQKAPLHPGLTDIQTEVRKKRWVAIFSTSAKYDFICEVRWNIDTHEDNLEFPTVQRQPWDVGPGHLDGGSSYKKNRSEFFHRPALGWRLARRGWGHHWHRQELLAPRRICRKDRGRQAGKKTFFAFIFRWMTSTDTSWQNRIQNGYIYLPIPSELVDDHSLVVDSNWQFSAHNPTCAWSCGQNCSTLVHKVD